MSLLGDHLGRSRINVIFLPFEELDNLSELLDTFLVKGKCVELGLSRLNFNEALCIGLG